MGFVLYLFDKRNRNQMKGKVKFSRILLNQGSDFLPEDALSVKVADTDVEVFREKECD